MTRKSKPCLAGGACLFSTFPPPLFPSLGQGKAFFLPDLFQVNQVKNIVKKINCKESDFSAE